MKSPRVALYERVSTDQQEFRSQHEALLAFCRRQGWKRPARLYSEKASRASARRTVLNQVLVDARLGRFDVLVVFKIDRLGSRALHMLQVVEELKRLKIRLITVHDHIDTEDKSGKSEMLLGFMSTIAGVDLASNRERTIAGMAAARLRGKHVGRPPNSPKKVALALFLRFKQNKNYAQIEKATGLSQSSISRIVNAKKGRHGRK